MSIRLLSLFVILIHPSLVYLDQTGVIQSQPAQLSPRSEIVVSLGASGPTTSQFSQNLRPGCGPDPWDPYPRRF